MMRIPILIDAEKTIWTLTIKIADGNLSISGSSRYSCGQVYDSIKPADKYQKALIDLWKRWHLNNLNARCEHQRKLWNTSEELKITTYIETTHLYQRINKVKDLINKKLVDTGEIKVGKLTREILAISGFYNDVTIKTLSPYLQKQFKVYKEETKTAGWIRESEHEKGLLCKPCPVCGYKYGTKWLKEELPPKIETAINYLIEKINETGVENE